MRIASDGKPYDVDNLPNDDGRPDEVEVIQYLRPSKEGRRMLAPVGEDYVEKAKDLIITAEWLGSTINICVRRKGESEEKEYCKIAVNGPGKKSPTNILREIIDYLVKEKQMYDSVYTLIT